MGGACSACGRQERYIHGCVGRPEGKRPLTRPRHRLEENIKMDLCKLDEESWIGLLWLRVGRDVGEL